ncbi:putative lipid II flippase FtsW [Psychromonas sp. Urea-02u-13]|uniref:putative lipid II flippase FtsW n=1 Tax=Psychromonas sp. Urea-02u-13 TaxID=2058326 RepID=UPI000C3310DF|nr:putative lipid II flippase FtsW [Psychromonas sp. Urea-02u-13]PKG39630.1 putative lipid II flippase FtsW [Psychromonas sp. Urea-02u-13]
MQKLRALFTFDDSNQPYDKPLLVIVLLLMCIGMVIVASASIPEGIALSNDPFRFLKRQALYVFICLTLIAGIVNVPFSFWYKRQMLILILSLTALLAVLVIGTEVNGSIRWLRLGPVNVQPSEFAKLAIVIFLASYLVRRQEEVVDTIKGFIKPLVVLSLFSIMLLLQPDLGSTVVIVVVMMGMLFIADAKLVNFIAIIVSLLAVIVALVVMSPYRMARVVGFLDPWSDPFGRSYQLTQSLMAFGRGGWFGQGLGNSVQKLEYLPEAHTDFIMAILAEELGFIGVSIVIILEFALVYRAFSIGKRALALKTPLVFAGYVAIGIAIWFFFQTAVNIGAASGIAPTKGLTLPLVSYGGSSLISIAIAVALLLRIDFETRIAASPLRLKKSDSKKKALESKTDEQ